ALVNRVEAIVTLNGIDFTPELSGFVTEYNIIATRYKNILAQEKGRREAAKNKEEEENNEENGNENNEGNGESGNPGANE
ncbi:MAG: hypothetical protein LBD64_01785, partial [Odoribacteraceae bacterium]|nr:hypothetical protein [Odoribacteraceae bacterium]